MTRVGGVLIGLGLVVVVVGIGIWLLGGPDDETPRSSAVARALTEARPATAPFGDLTETQLRVGDRTLRIAVADAEAERVQGLRSRADLGSYDGMLFVFPGPTDTSFTMSTVPVALDVGFYDDAGHLVGRQAMQPCAGSDLTCPVYGAPAPFRFALETLAGRLPLGRLAPA